MKKIKKKYFVISNKTFGLNLNVFINYSFEDLNKFLIKRKIKPLENKYQYSTGVAFSTHHQENDGIPYFTIWFKNFDWKISYQALLIHELVHFVLMSANYKGININNPENDANETLAYLIEFFFRECSFKLNLIYK